MLTRYSVQFGYYAGFLAGIVVDNMTSGMAFAMAAGLSGLSYSTLALVSTSEWTNGIAILVCVHLIITGYAAGIATLASFKASIINFNRVIAILPIALLVSYMKMAPMADMSIKAVFFPETELITYLFYAAAMTSGTYLLSMFFVRRIEMTREHARECADSDTYGFIFFFLVLGLYTTYNYVGEMIFESEGASFYSTLIFMGLNYVMVVPACIV